MITTSPPLQSQHVLAVVRDPQSRGELLPVLSSAEIAAIEKLLDPVVEIARESCEQWNLPSDLLFPTALLCIVQLGHLPPEAIAIRVSSTLWIFALDDLLDDPNADFGLLARTSRECLLVACGDTAVQSPTHLASALQSLKVALSAYSNFQWLYPFWLTSLQRVMEAMIYERLIQIRPVPPSLDEYLWFASQSISVTHTWITGLVLENHAKFKSCVGDLIHLANQCGVVMRLANDLATFERERNVANAVTVLLSELRVDGTDMFPSGLIADARRQLGDRLAFERDRMHQYAESIRSGTAVEGSFTRATDFGVELYAKSDFRTWASKLVAAGTPRIQGVLDCAR